MKKFIIAVAAVAVGFVQANAMSHTRAQAEALFLTDKMAYELNLTNAQYDAVYEINYDYFASLVGTSDIFGIFWSRRERELEWVLTSGQYRIYLATTYFNKPVGVYDNVIRFAIYDHYAHDRYYKPVRHIHKVYHGGHDYRAPAHKEHHGHLAHHGHHGNLAPAPKPNGNHNGGHKPSGNHNPGKVAPNNGGNHNPGKVAPNNGSNKPNGNTTPKVKPNNGGNHNGANVGGNTSKPRTGGSAARTSATPRASKNAPEGRRTSSAVRK